MILSTTHYKRMDGQLGTTRLRHVLAGNNLYADLEAERLISAEKAECKIVGKEKGS